MYVKKVEGDEMTVEEQLKKEQDKRLEELSDKLSEQEKDIAELKEKLSRKAAREERKAAKKESRSDLPGQVLKFFLTVLCSVIITLLAIRLTDVENGKSGKGKDTQTVLPVGQQLHEPTENKQEPTRVDISVEENAFNIYSCLEPFDVVLENAENYIGSSRLSFKIRVIPNVDHLRFNVHNCEILVALKDGTARSFPIGVNYGEDDYFAEEFILEKKLPEHTLAGIPMDSIQEIRMTGIVVYSKEYVRKYDRTFDLVLYK